MFGQAVVRAKTLGRSFFLYAVREKGVVVSCKFNRSYKGRFRSPALRPFRLPLHSFLCKAENSNKPPLASRGFLVETSLAPDCFTTCPELSLLGSSARFEREGTREKRKCDGPALSNL